MKTIASNLVLTLAFCAMASTTPLAVAVRGAPARNASAPTATSRTLAADESADDTKKAPKKEKADKSAKKGGDKKDKSADPAPAGGW